MAMREGVTVWECDSPGCSCTVEGTDLPSEWGQLAFDVPAAITGDFPRAEVLDGKVEMDLCPACASKVGEFILFLLKEGTGKLPKPRQKRDTLTGAAK